MSEAPPVRNCNGGPLGPWCGKPAEVVCTDDTGLQWYACDETTHRAGARKTMPIAEWWRLVDDRTAKVDP